MSDPAARPARLLEVEAALRVAQEGWDVFAARFQGAEARVTEIEAERDEVQARYDERVPEYVRAYAVEAQARAAAEARVAEVEAERDKAEARSWANAQYWAEASVRAQKAEARGERLEEALRAARATFADFEMAFTMFGKPILAEAARIAMHGGQAGPVAEREADLGDAAEPRPGGGEA